MTMYSTKKKKRGSNVGPIKNPHGLIFIGSTLVSHVTTVPTLRGHQPLLVGISVGGVLRKGSTLISYGSSLKLNSFPREPCSKPLHSKADFEKKKNLNLQLFDLTSATVVIIV